MSLRRVIRILKRVVLEIAVDFVVLIAYSIAFSLATMIWIVDKILELSKEQRALIMDSFRLIFYVGATLYIWGSSDVLVSNVADAFFILGFMALIMLQTERIGNDLLAIQIESIESRREDVDNSALIHRVNDLDRPKIDGEEDHVNSK